MRDENMEKNFIPLLEMSEVSVASAARPNVAQLENVNWRLMPGDFWLIAGPHGSGKSDFLATAAALQRPLSGTVRWFGEDAWELKGDELVGERRRVGLVFENGGRMFRNLTVAENVA